MDNIKKKRKKERQKERNKREEKRKVRTWKYDSCDNSIASPSRNGNGGTGKCGNSHTECIINDALNFVQIRLMRVLAGFLCMQEIKWSLSEGIHGRPGGRTGGERERQKFWPVFAGMARRGRDRGDEGKSIGKWSSWAEREGTNVVR